MAQAKRVLILARTAKLASLFLAPAEKLALSVLFGCSDKSGDLCLDFSTRDAALSLVTYAQEDPIAAIVAVGDETAPVAARAASILGLPFHAPKAADVCRDKRLLECKLQASGLSFGNDCKRVAGDAPYEFVAASLMSQGRLRLLAGLYRGHAISPADFDPELKRYLSDSLRRVVPLLGLKHGPVNLILAETRQHFHIADISCSYLPCKEEIAMRFAIPLVDQDLSFEELILRNALDLNTTRVLLKLSASL